MPTPRIAVLVTDIDSLLLMNHIDPERMVYFVWSKSPILPWMKRYLPDLDIVPYTLHDRASITDCYLHEILVSSDIVHLMNQMQLKYLLPTQKVTQELVHVSVKERFFLVGPLFTHMHQFENKIWFDRFLKAHQIPSPRSIVSSVPLIRFPYPFVIQDPTSWGSEGTFIIEGKSGLKQFDPSHTFLIREFIKGLTYGITVCITEDAIRLSALRMQCSTEKAAFAGIQWIPTSQFPTGLLHAMHEVFGRLGNAMKAEGYAGWASFDFIVDESEQIYVIECNPRFTAASAHVLQHPELCGSDSLEDILIPRSSLSKTSVSVSEIPESVFQGSTMEVVVEADTPAHLPPPGVYEMKNKLVTYRDTGLESCHSMPGSLFFYTDAVPGEIYEESAVAGMVISQCSLYDGYGHENATTREVIQFFTRHERS